MAGAEFNIVILSSSPPAPELYSPQDAPPSSQRVAMRAYSPFSPSPPTSPKRYLNGALVSGSKAVVVPPTTARGFATVGSLMRSEHFAQPMDDDSTDAQLVQSRRGSLEDMVEAPPAKKPRKRVTKASVAVEGEPKSKPPPKTRKAKVNTDDHELRAAPTKSSYFATADAETTLDAPNEVPTTAPKLTKAGKPRKPRTKKEKVEGVTDLKPKRTRVTKPKVAKATGKTQRGNVRIVSAHFPDKDEHNDTTAEGLADKHVADNEPSSIWDLPSSPRLRKQASSKPPSGPLTEGLDLDEAVARRRDWTPPRDTNTTDFSTPFTDSTGKENRPLVMDASASFGSMLTSFAYAQSPSAKPKVTTTKTMIDVVGSIKRRRAEPVSVPSHSRNSSPEKGKAPKKKPRTITDIVTEQYASKDPATDPSTVTSEFFPSRTTTTTKKVPLNDTTSIDPEAPSKKPPRKRATSKTTAEKAEPKAKAKRAPAKSKAKPKPVAEKLLSPASAVLRMDTQSILFGTSSQLAIEESPTTVRQIQQAMRESEHDADLLSDIFSQAPPRWPKLGKVIGQSNLWEASARDVEGGLLEQMEDVYIPEPDRTQDIALLMDGAHDEPDAAPEFVDIDDLEPPLDVIISSNPPTPLHVSQHVSPTMATPVNHANADNYTFKNIDDFEQEPPPSNQNAKSQDSFADIDDFNFPPSAQLRVSPLPKAVAPALATSNGSPKKRRGKPPKSMSAVPTVTASSASASKQSTSKPAVSRVKAKKSPPRSPATPPKSTGRFIDIEEILDSEDEALEILSPTPPRIHSSPDIPLALTPRPPSFAISTPPLPSTASIGIATPTTTDGVTRVHRIPAPHLEYTHIKPHLFAQITAHVRSMTPTTDPKKPNWHEKILMYDPIVLEDFTAYLNMYTSIRLYRRATQKQVKEWNKFQKNRAEKDVSVDLVDGGGDAVFSMDGDLQDVLAVERELEAIVVRDWCESQSVCAIWSKEGRKKGSARKGFY